jgi:hypothetical protein
LSFIFLVLGTDFLTVFLLSLLRLFVMVRSIFFLDKFSQNSLDLYSL